MTLESIAMLIQQLGGTADINTPSLGVSDFSRLEARLRSPLDSTFRNFAALASGRAWTEAVAYPIPGTNELGPVSHFYGGGSDLDPNAIWSALAAIEGQFLDGWLPIADEGMGNMICLNSRTLEIGLWDHQAVDEDASLDSEKVVVVARNLESWLLSLQRTF